ncbi:MAG: ATP-binding protein [Candidatus Korobacteraceae bacterium]
MKSPHFNGLDSGHKSKIFEPFFSPKDTKGTGLGLWVTRGIVQKHEGALQFRSISSGNQVVTCFSVFIPAETKVLRAKIPAETRVED